jgi:hypothetical protein
LLMTIGAFPPLTIERTWGSPRKNLRSPDKRKTTTNSTY